jgi:preprotein translocase SecE subunit
MWRQVDAIVTHMLDLGRKSHQIGSVADIISELRKVTWPARGDVAYLTMVVIVIALIVGAILGTFDLFFGWLIEQTILR